MVFVVCGNIASLAIQKNSRYYNLVDRFIVVYNVRQIRSIVVLKISYFRNFNVLLWDFVNLFIGISNAAISNLFFYSRVIILDT